MVRIAIVLTSSLFSIISFAAGSESPFSRYLQLREKYVANKVGNFAVDFDSKEYKNLEKTSVADQVLLKAELLKAFGGLKNLGFTFKDAQYNPSLLAGNTDSYCVDSLLLTNPDAPADKGVSLRITDSQLIKNSAQEPLKKRFFLSLTGFARLHMRELVCSDASHTIIAEIPLTGIKGYDGVFASVNSSSQEGEVTTPNEIVCIGKKKSVILAYVFPLKGEDTLPDEESCKSKFAKCYRNQLRKNKELVKHLQSICQSQLNRG